MRLKIGHPSFPEFDFYLLALTPEAEAHVNHLGPHTIVASRLDWPVIQNNFYYGWADKLNQLWWPRGGDQFANTIILLDEYRNALLEALVAAQKSEDKDPGTQLTVTYDMSSVLRTQPGGSATLASATATSTLTSGSGTLTLGTPSVNAVDGTVTFTVDGGTAGAGHLINVQATTTDSAVVTFYGTIRVTRSTTSAPEDVRPYLVLQALLSPAEGATAAEGYDPAEVDPVLVETELLAWKVYPLPPVVLPEADATDSYGGLWLLPLVDLRYFWRLGPLSVGQEGSSSSGFPTSGDYPVIDIEETNDADWMPDLLAYPDDLSAPLDYDPIEGNGTQSSITATTIRGPAADVQAAMQGWRVVCRDVRSHYNATPTTGTPHTEFAGIISDYPDAADATQSYHLDAIRLAQAGSLIAGGLIDPATSRALLPRKLRVLFRISDGTTAYEITSRTLADDPASIADIGEDANGPSAAERLVLPRAVLGVDCPSESPTAAERDALLLAAQQWSLLYYRWRRKPCYYQFPGLAPVIPNGAAGIIVWTFASTEYSTRYVAVNSLAETEPVDSVGGSGSAGASEGFWARLTAKAHPLDPAADEADDGDEDNVFGEAEYLLYNHTRYEFVRLSDSDSPKAITWTAESQTGYAYEVNNVNVPVDVGGGGSSSSNSSTHLPTIVFVRKGAGDYYLFEYTARWEFVRRTSAAGGDGTFGGALLYWDQTSEEWEAHEGVLLMDVNAS